VLSDELHAWIQRASAGTDAEVAARDELEEAALYRWHRTLSQEPGRLAELVERHATLTAATCQRADPARGDEMPAEFDVVIVDEAARAGIDVLIPMSLGRSVILVGDHRQLPPHIQHELEAQLEQGLRERVDLKRESLFSWLWHQLPRSNVVSLARQYRMHEDIGRAVSRLFYEPEVVLEHNHTTRSQFGVCGDEPLVWIDTADVMHDPTERAAKGIDKWPCDEENDYEARLIIQMIERADRDALFRFQKERGQKPIGVIPFYGRQVEGIFALLHSRLDTELVNLVQLGTVDSFQGREFPLVFVSTVRSNSRGFVGFLRLPNRVNVAMSRAQRQLILIGDSRTIAARDTGSDELRRLHTDLTSGLLRGRILRSTEVVR
jgi:superfamily I DNA and/or RNA helicase